MNQMYVPPLSRINKTIIIAYVGLFLLYNLLKLTAGVDITAYLALSGAGLKQGLIYQLVTFPFVETHLLSTIFNALILWFIGSELEHKWGERFYLKFLLITTYIGGLIYAVIGVTNQDVSFMPFQGIAGTNLALLVAYGMIFSERILVFMFIFPMKAKYFCMILAAIEIFMALTSSVWASATVHCVSGGVAFLYLRYASFVARGGSLAQLKKERSKERMRGKLRLVKEEEPPEKPDPNKPKYWQ